MIDLKKRRLELGLTMLEVATAVGVSEATISRYESGNIKNMRRDRIEKYAAVLKVKPSAFIEDENASPSSTPYPRNATPTITGNNLEVVPPPDAMVRIPVIGRVAAGLQCFADMQIEEYAPCDASLLHTGYDYVYLRVTGDSMEPELHEGDKVLVQVRDTVESGDYAVVIVDGDDGLVKKIEYSKTQLTLISENPYYPPRRFQRDEMNRVRIFGKVVGLSRSF